MAGSVIVRQRPETAEGLAFLGLEDETGIANPIVTPSASSVIAWWEDLRALPRARAAGHSTLALIRKGLRVVASRYYAGRRRPSTCLFESMETPPGRYRPSA